MKLIEVLVQEHRTIERMLQVLDRVCVKIRAGDAVDGAMLESAVAWVAEYADHWHHHKEEDLLFPALEAAGVPREGGPVGVMLFEHDNGRKYLDLMGQGARQLAAKERGGGEAFCRAVRQYTFLIEQHIHKEDHVLYHMAEELIQAETAQVLAEAVEGWIEAWAPRLERLEAQLSAWEEEG